MSQILTCKYMGISPPPPKKKKKKKMSPITFQLGSYAVVLEPSYYPLPTKRVPLKRLRGRLPSSGPMLPHIQGRSSTRCYSRLPAVLPLSQSCEVLPLPSLFCAFVWSLSQLTPVSITKGLLTILSFSNIYSTFK